jgi:signal peptidase
MFQEISTELLARGYGVRFRPAGHSMHPTIRDGEAVTVAPVRASDVRRGDIILYRAERGFIAHRVLQLKGGADAPIFITRGDASTSCDAPVSASQVLGRVICVERNGSARSLEGQNWGIVEEARLRVSQLRGALSSGFLWVMDRTTRLFI